MTGPGEPPGLRPLPAPTEQLRSPRPACPRVSATSTAHSTGRPASRRQPALHTPDGGNMRRPGGVMDRSGRRSRVLLVVAATATALWSPSPAGAATTVACGAVITVDTRLGNDLRNCHGIGIVIGADGVDLDLNGHTVDGDGIGDVEGINVDGHRDTSV